MNSRNFALTFCLLLAPFITPAVSGQAARTWVSGVGSDANPCSRTVPCRTFAGAIAKTAAGGEIDVLDPGSYGTVTITKAITIDGGSNFAGILVPSFATGIEINTGALDRVTLRNLSVNGQGAGNNIGIRCFHCFLLRVENCTISSLAKGIQVDFWFQLPFDGGITADHVRVADSQYGFVAANPLVVTNSSSVDNTFGFYASGPPAKLTISHSVASGNSVGVRAEQQAVVALSDVAVVGNFEGLQYTTGATGGQIVSFGDNAIFDNVGSQPPTTTVSKQ
jgi:hypothetical protein